MATADDYAAWIVANKSKKGTPEFNTVAKAYELAKQEESAALAPPRSTSPIAQEEEARPAQPPSWSDVMRNVAPQVVAGTADLMLTTPANVANLAKAAYGTAVTSLGGEMPKDPQEAYRQQLRANLFQLTGGKLGEPIPYTSGVAAAPEVEIPPNRVTDFFREQGLIKDLPNITPGQRIASTAAQAGLGAMLGGGGGLAQAGRNILTSATAGGAGQAVTEATGSPVAGLATSVLTPLAGSKVNALNNARAQEMRLNQEYDRSIREAKDLGFLVIPEGRAANFVGQDTLEEIVKNQNQKVINDIAKSSIGFKSDDLLNNDELRKYRLKEYNRGYAPFINTMKSVDVDEDYLAALYEIEVNPSYDTEKMMRIIDKIHRRGIKQSDSITSFDPKFIKERVSNLRSDAQKNRRDSKDSDTYNLGTAQRELADALENLMERQLTKDYVKKGLGEAQAKKIVENFRESRKNIAVAHVIEDVLEKGSGRIMLDKLADSYQRGDYLTGDLEKAAKFANVYTPPKGSRSAKTRYGYAGGMSLAAATAASMGLPVQYAALLALGGAAAGRMAQAPLQKATQEYLLSRRSAIPFVSPAQTTTGVLDYTSMGINPRMAFPAAVGMFSTMQNQPEENQ